MLQWIKKNIPTREQMQKNGHLSWFGDGIYKRSLWSFNQESIARGFGIGLFVAILPIPLQTLIAMGCAALCKGNLPVAFAATWVSNPITFTPICLLIFKVGQLLIDGDEVASIPQTLTWNHITQNFSQYLESFGKPFLVGLPIVAVCAGLGGYILARITWRLFKHKSN